MPDDKWKQSVNDDIKACTEFRVRLEEHDKSQQRELDKANNEIVELYDHKNAIKDRLTIVETDKIGATVFRKFTNDVAVLKSDTINKETFNKLGNRVNGLITEKKFLPWLAVIISVVIGLGTLFMLFSKPVKGDDCPHVILKKETIPQVIKALNEYEITKRLGFRFDCKNQDSETPIVNMYLQRSRNECIRRKEQLQYLIDGVSFTWNKSIGNKTVHAYDNDECLVFMMTKDGKFKVIDDNFI